MRNLSVVSLKRQQSPQATIKIERRSDGLRVRLRHKDDLEFQNLVDDLKQSIDFEYRLFDRELRSWIIDLSAEAALSEFALRWMKNGAAVTWPTSDDGSGVA
jgi:hypothetical protein